MPLKLLRTDDAELNQIQRYVDYAIRALEAEIAGIDTSESDDLRLYGTITIGVSGAVSDSDCDGFTFVKDGASSGRYNITITTPIGDAGRPTFRWLGVNVVDTTGGTPSEAIPYYLRSETVSTTGVLQMQMYDSTTYVDDNPVSGATLHVAIDLTRNI